MRTTVSSAERFSPAWLRQRGGVRRIGEVIDELLARYDLPGSTTGRCGAEVTFSPLGACQRTAGGLASHSGAR